MLYINKPIICEYCGLPITTYSYNNSTDLIDFKCSCRRITSLSEMEYVKKIKDQRDNKK